MIGLSLTVSQGGGAATMKAEIKLCPSSYEDTPSWKPPIPENSPGT